MNLPSWGTEMGMVHQVTDKKITSHIDLPGGSRVTFVSPNPKYVCSECQTSSTQRLFLYDAAAFICLVRRLSESSDSEESKLNEFIKYAEILAASYDEAFPEDQIAST